MSGLPELDPLIHAPSRLRVMSTLSQLGVGDTLSFSRLQGLLDMTSGNLITHLRKLDDAGYVRMTTDHGEAAKTTTLELTEDGRRAFLDYRVALQQWLEDPETVTAHPDSSS